MSKVHPNVADSRQEAIILLISLVAKKLYLTMPYRLTIYEVGITPHSQLEDLNGRQITLHHEYAECMKLGVVKLSVEGPSLDEDERPMRESWGCLYWKDWAPR